MVLPRDFMRTHMAHWLLAPAPILLTEWAMGHHAWELDYRLFSLFVSATLGALIAGAVAFFMTKRMLSDIRSVLAGEIDDPVERATLVTMTSLVRKMQYVVLGAVLGTALLVVSLGQSRASFMVTTAAQDWQVTVLTSLAPMVLGGASVEKGLDALLPDSTITPYPAHFGILDPTRLLDIDGRLPEHLAAHVARALEAGKETGRSPANSSVGAVAWRTLADGRVLVSMQLGDPSSEVFRGFYFTLVLAMILSLGASLGVAYLMADDFRRGTRALVADAERMASGDLRSGNGWEAEDEMGVLGRAFERMNGALRETIRGVAEAADRVDAAATEISSKSQSVAIASADQVRRIQQASELMIQIKEQVSDVSGSAQALNESVEESSSSILELGAAGDELNDTASVLSTKVEEVSGSIEQMVRSVSQVSETTQGLTDAASETSSSMEVMASAMRAVDTTAETTARLSSDVVRLAESGQIKVSQTIAGMHAIRDATDAAEQVVRGLGGRTKEIGSILDVIEDVADETNLLALNAAIIAAQAGEHGRAFSVVADEIKELADRVLASTKEVGELIRAVQAESENAIGAIEVGSGSVAGGVELSAEAGTALEEITTAARESGQRIGEIVSAVREQTKATTHVAALMEGVLDGVEQISQAAGEQHRGNEVVHRSALTMRDVSQQVRRTTEEQSRGFVRIRESAEGVRDAVEAIGASLQEQTAACRQVAEFLEQVFQGTRSNEQAVRSMADPMRDLLSQADALRVDVAKFRI
jgi:methyl-accepting chemotaxis protein